MIERVKIAIDQAQAILNTITDSNRKQEVSEALAVMKAIYQQIVDNNWPCPPHLEAAVDRALKGIEELYNKTACN